MNRKIYKITFSVSSLHSLMGITTIDLWDTIREYCKNYSIKIIHTTPKYSSKLSEYQKRIIFLASPTQQNEFCEFMIISLNNLIEITGIYVYHGLVARNITN